MLRHLFKKLPGFILAAGSCLLVLLAPGIIPENVPAAQAQSANPKVMATQVYERLPDFPREDQYRERGRSNLSDSTLVSRLIQYHTFVKGRLPIYRLDWQITLADYLGINDYIREDTYPGQGFLHTNPMAADVVVVQQLSRSQRRALIQTLVDVFTGSPPTEAPAQEAIPPTSRAETSPRPVTPSLPPLPTPGSADLLLPPQQPAPSRPRPSGDAQHLLLD